MRQGSRQASQRPCLFSAEVLVNEILRSKVTRPDKPLSALGILGSSLSVLIGMEVCRVCSKVCEDEDWSEFTTQGGAFLS